jgi:hypothetical protein
LASSSSFFFLMSWFLRRCSRTRCSSGLLSTPRPLEWGSCQETLPSPPVNLTLVSCNTGKSWEMEPSFPILQRRAARSQDTAQVTAITGQVEDLNPDCLTTEIRFYLISVYFLRMRF